MGAGVFTAVGNPITWAAIAGLATFQVSKKLYKRSRKKSKIRKEEYDLFI
tara:strand:- start:966 stop:1115 length:150 start_codon:yes stop_codon:yes gene_type:complete